MTDEAKAAARARQDDADERSGGADVQSAPVAPDAADVARRAAVRARAGAQEKLSVILGADGLRRLTDARVMVLGCGGVGSNCIEALARGGVGHLVILDADVVSPSNINRQAVAFQSTVGRRKTEVMRAIVADINPLAEVEVIDRFLLHADVPGLLAPYVGSVDFFVDAIDSVAVKLAVAQFADAHGLRLISSMGGGNKLHPERLRLADISETVNCPLARVMRKECRKRGIRRLQVLYSDEEPVRTSARPGAARRERAGLGTASFMPPIMGQMIAGAVIRELSGVEAGGEK